MARRKAVTIVILLRKAWQQRLRYEGGAMNGAFLNMKSITIAKRDYLCELTQVHQHNQELPRCHH